MFWGAQTTENGRCSAPGLCCGSCSRCRGAGPRCFVFAKVLAELGVCCCVLTAFCALGPCGWTILVSLYVAAAILAKAVAGLVRGGQGANEVRREFERVLVFYCDRYRNAGGDEAAQVAMMGGERRGTCDGKGGDEDLSEVVVQCRPVRIVRCRV